MQKFVKLSYVAKYSNTRVKCSDLNPCTYVGTDNLLQDKKGKEKSICVPTDGFTTAYQKGDTLISNIRPYLKKIWFACNNGGSSADVLTIRPNDVVPKFLYYSLFQDAFFLYAMKGSKGTKMPRGDKKQIMNFKVPYIDKSQQQKIADALSVLDDKIELNNRINSQLEQMAKNLYNYWFVQFDFPDGNKRPYKSSGGKMVYNETIKQNIPVGWKVENLGNIFDTYLGGTPSRNISEYWTNGNIHWLSSGEIANFPITTSLEYISISGLKNSATSLLPLGSIMISITGNIRVSILAIEACANQSVVGIKESQSILKSYIYFYLNNRIQQYEALMTGAVQKHINKDVVDCTPFVVPQADILTKFQNTVEPIMHAVLHKAKENIELSKMRDFLLPMLMNGQVSVS